MRGKEPYYLAPSAKTGVEAFAVILEAMPDRRMLDIAEKIIEQQAGTFDPSTFKDRYEGAVSDPIARKKRGKKMTTAPPVERDDDKVVDLMDALRRSLAGQDGGSKEHAERFLERKKGKAIAHQTMS